MHHRHSLCRPFLATFGFPFCRGFASNASELYDCACKTGCTSVCAIRWTSLTNRCAADLKAAAKGNRDLKKRKEEDLKRARAEPPKPAVKDSREPERSKRSRSRDRSRSRSPRRNRRSRSRSRSRSPARRPVIKVEAHTLINIMRNNMLFNREADHKQTEEASQHLRRVDNSGRQYVNSRGLHRTTFSCRAKLMSAFLNSEEGLTLAKTHDEQLREKALEVDRERSPSPGRPDEGETYDQFKLRRAKERADHAREQAQRDEKRLAAEREKQKEETKQRKLLKAEKKRKRLEQLAKQQGTGQGGQQPGQQGAQGQWHMQADDDDDDDDMPQHPHPHAPGQPISYESEEIKRMRAEMIAEGLIQPPLPPPQLSQSSLLAPRSVNYPTAPLEGVEPAAKRARVEARPEDYAAAAAAASLLQPPPMYSAYSAQSTLR